MRAIAYILLSLYAGSVFAQRTGQDTWLNLDYTYSNIAYSEALMNEKGAFAGVRGDLGLTLTDFIGISVGGEYRDGHFNYNGSTFSGTPVQVVTKDYIRDTRALLHLFYGPVVLSAGVAQREWFDNLVISYRRRTTYNYWPVALTIYRDALYVKAEADIWKGGKNRSYMSDVSASEHDVNFTQNSGTGFGVEVGLLIPSPAKFSTRLFVAYHRWDVNDSDTQNDGVYNLVEPKSNTVTIEGGLGLSF